MKSFVKAAAFATLLVATGAQAADLGGPASMGGYKDDVAYSWWNAGDIFVRLRGEAVLPDTKSTGTVPNLKASDEAIPEADISYFLTKNIAIEAICCVSQARGHCTAARRLGTRRSSRRRLCCNTISTWARLSLTSALA